MIAAACENPPLVSCIMPTYGRPAYVNEAVAMFLADDYPHKELIVLNDCSDQTFTFDHPEVRVINAARRYPTLGDKRNACVELAAGPIIALMDDDDVYLPWRLSFTVAEMRRRDAPLYRPAEYLAYWGQTWLHNNQAIPGWMTHAMSAFEKRLWREVGGYPARNVSEDSAFFNKIDRMLGKGFHTQPIRPEDRFFILRGKSRYRHISMVGGEGELDLTPGEYRIAPCDLSDPLLCRLRDAHIERRRAKLPPDQIVGT